MNWKDVPGSFGLAQAWALFPGTSRSGITMTAGLMLRLTAAKHAARFLIPAVDPGHSDRLRAEVLMSGDLPVCR